MQTHFCLVKPILEDLFVLVWYFRKYTYGHVCPAKIQISLHIRAGWSESSLGTFWIANNAKFLHVDNKDSDQTAWKPRFRWVFVRCNCQKVCFPTLWLYFWCSKKCYLEEGMVLSCIGQQDISSCTQVDWYLTKHYPSFNKLYMSWAQLKYNKNILSDVHKARNFIST